MGVPICPLTGRDKMPLPAVLASLLFHVLLYLLLATSAVLLPCAAKSPKFEFVWIQPVPGSDTKVMEPPAESPDKHVPAPESGIPTDATQGTRAGMEPPAPRNEPNKAEPEKPAQQVEREARHDDGERNVPVAKQAEEASMRLKVKTAAPETARPVQMKADAAREAAARKHAEVQQEQTRLVQEAEREQQARMKLERLRSEIMEKDRRAKQATAEAEKKRTAARSALQERSSASVVARKRVEPEGQAVPSRKQLSGQNTVKLRRTEKPIVNEAAAVEAVRPAGHPVVSEIPGRREKEPAGNFLPRLRGDLKLEVIGDDEVKINVQFRQFLKKRRTRALTRTEAARVQKLAPRLARVARDTSEAVIEVAGEGIYEFIAEPIGKKSARAAYVLTLYEGGSRTAKKPIGNREIHGKTSIVKVLMPEGIRWDDDAAFSGSIKDSESVTKFVTDTGLLWKEYSE